MTLSAQNHKKSFKAAAPLYPGLLRFINQKRGSCPLFQLNRQTELLQRQVCLVDDIGPNSFRVSVTPNYRQMTPCRHQPVRHLNDRRPGCFGGHPSAEPQIRIGIGTRRNAHRPVTNRTVSVVARLALSDQFISGLDLRYFKFRICRRGDRIDGTGPHHRFGKSAVWNYSVTQRSSVPQHRALLSAAPETNQQSQMLLPIHGKGCGSSHDAGLNVIGP